MKKLLVPIDFSTASQTGFDCALQLNSITPLEIFTLNVFQKVHNNYTDEVSLSIEREAQKKRLAQLSKMTEGYPHLSTNVQPKAEIHHLVKCGDIVDEIIAAAEEKAVDLILIATKAKHNLWEYIFGSISTNLIKKTTKPVLIVPEGLSFEKPQNIAFANDFSDNDLSLKFLDHFAAIFGAKIRQVHVNTLPSDFYNLKEEVVSNIDVKEDDYRQETNIVRDTSVKRGLDFFIEKYNIDLLALHLPQRTFVENLLHRSVSKQLVLNSKIPLLILKE